MNATTRCLLPCLFLIGVPAPPDEPTDKDRMQGTWITVEYKTGNEESDKEFLGRLVKIAGDTLETFNGADQSEGKFSLTLDPAKKPKQIDLHRVKGEKKITMPGIYAIEKGKLHVAWSTRPGAARPADFKMPGGDAKIRVITLERAKE